MLWLKPTGAIYRCCVCRPIISDIQAVSEKRVQQLKKTYIHIFWILKKA